MELDREEFDAMFSLIDLDGDNQLALLEFESFVKGQLEVMQFEAEFGTDGWECVDVK
jgi:hypothetical protein